jgi:uncharacterized protein
MQKLTIEYIKDNELLIFESISGSRLYGLDTATSDTDIRGVFILPKNMFYGLEYTGQVNNETNDIVYYELKKFIELLSKNNPNILEMLNVTAHCVLYKHPIMDMIKPEMFLSKLCERTFANYAFTQIKKAFGLEKKIVNPVEEERKSVLDFCYVHTNKDAVALKVFLEEDNMMQTELGLSSITHLRDCYNLYYSTVQNYAGIAKKENANDVNLSSIPKEEKPIGILYFNKDGYSTYCKRYKDYWDWVAKRNDERFKTTMSHGKNYDSKNMMHVFRLLFMAKEIAIEGKINVHRNDRAFLLAIKEGKFEYDDLVEQAEEMKEELPLLYEKSGLMDEPDMEKVDDLLIKMRNEYYDVTNL